MLAFRRLCSALKVSKSMQRGGMVRSLLARSLSSESDAHLRVELLENDLKGSCSQVRWGDRFQGVQQTLSDTAAVSSRTPLDLAKKNFVAHCVRHRLQLSRNLQDSTGFLEFVPGPRMLRKLSRKSA